MINKFNLLNQKKHMLVGASLIRIAFGLIILYNYTIHYSQRYFLWGPNGLVGTDSVTESFLYNLSLYSLSTSNLYFNIIFHLGILIAIVFLMGYKGRLISVLNFIFVWSLMSHNNLILDGGDNILRIMLFYLIFADTTQYFSVDAQIRAYKKKVNTNLSSKLSLRFLLHNLAILAFLVQVCILYFTSGLHKAMGELWQNGTAIYYILQVNEFSHPFFKDIIFASDFFLVVGAYLAIIVQLAFPFLLFNKKTKYIGMLGVIGMHTGIFLVMGLFSFSFIMIANQLLFLTDKEYRWIGVFSKKRYERIRYLFKPKSQKTINESESLVLILYDGWCPFCTKSIKRFQSLDWLKRLEFVSFRESGVAKKYGISMEDLENRMHSILKRNGKVEAGIYSINRVCKSIPLLWLFVPFINISIFLGIGQKVYDMIAKRRTIFPTGSCDVDCLLPLEKQEKEV